MRTDFVLDALEQALDVHQPERNGNLACHSGRNTSASVTAKGWSRLGIEPSMGSMGHNYDNAFGRDHQRAVQGRTDSPTRT